MIEQHLGEAEHERCRRSIAWTQSPGGAACQMT